MDHPKDHSILLFWPCTSREWIYIYIYIYIIYIIYKYRSFLFFWGESNLDSTIATCVVLMRFPLISEGLFFLTEIYRGNGNHLVMHRWWSFMRSTWHLELIGNRRILERYTVQPKWLLFWLEFRPCLGGLTFKHRGQLGSRYAYKTSDCGLLDFGLEL